MAFSDLIGPLVAADNLTEDQASALMRYLMSGEATDAQIGATLTALRIKGCTAVELAAFASVMRDNATALDHGLAGVVDTCGTGGGRPSFNISTASAIVAAAAGAKIAKHGNRAVTSKCGSADVLEALGAKIQGTQDELRRTLEEVGIVFLFAPAHHPAMRFVGKARKELGFRTVFNQLGPLANPALAKRQLIGVYDPDLMLNMGEALNHLGTERAILAHGNDGLDEISPVTGTTIVRVWDGKVTQETMHPSMFGIEPLEADAISPGDDLEENVAIFRQAISDLESPRFKAILPSTAVTLWICDIAKTLPEGVAMAREVVREGRAVAKLEELVKA